MEKESKYQSVSANSRKDYLLRKEVFKVKKKKRKNLELYMNSCKEGLIIIYIFLKLISKEMFISLIV